MKFLQILIAAIIGSLIAFAGLKYANLAGLGAQASSDQPAFERVMKTRTIRCAYSTWAPYINVDPNTKRLSGITYDIFEQAGRILNLKVEWVEEVPFSQVADNLMSGRNDVMCQTMWPSGNRAASLDFTTAIIYTGAYAYARAADARFDGDLSKIDDSGVTVSVIDGDFTQAIANEDYPHAKQLSMPMDSDGTQLLLAVTTKKADIAFVDPFFADEFMSNNPGTLKAIANAPAVRVFGSSYAVAKGETKLRDTLNVALNQMNQSGFIRATLDKYLGDHKGLYFYPAKPWEQ
jgi:ABC-type amino acid transport substrate-binding protein